MNHEKFDIIFLDPPYKTDFGQNAIEIIISNNMLKKDGIIVFETDGEEKYIDFTKELIKVIEIRRYGRVKLVFLGRKEKM